MESRIRKLFHSRRSKSQHHADHSELDLHSIPYTTATPQSRLPVIISHALRRSSLGKRQSDLTTDLRSFSYQSTLPGKPPQLGERPQRGNGPVKFQTSRRLSSGEVLISQHDYDRTLEDIRQGDIILAGKERKNPRALSQPSASMPRPRLAVLSSAPNSPRSQSAFSPVRQLADQSPQNEYYPRSPPASSNFMHERQWSVEQSYPSAVSGPEVMGLGISSPTHSLFPRHMASTASLLEPHEEGNPTLQALWRAEHSRLTSIYGEDGVEGAISELEKCRSPSTSHYDSRSMTPFILDPSPSSTVSLQQSPCLQHDFGRARTPLRSHMSTSNLELGYRDDNSDGSSRNRHSFLSNSGGSSFFTTRTSMVEESPMTRDDLRRIVDDMRMTYLQALEAEVPPPLERLPDLPIPKSRVKKQTQSLASSASVESGLRSMAGRSRTTSWQPPSTSRRTSAFSPSIRPQKKRASSGHSRKTSTQPVAGITALSPIKASPARPKRVDANQEISTGLKRADSTTLGSLAKELKILDNRSSTNSSHPTLPSSPTFYDSSSSESIPEIYKNAPLVAVKPLTSPAPPTPRTPQQRVESFDASAGDTSSHEESNRFFADADIDLALDLDNFESLCDEFFNSPTLSSDNFSHVSFETGDGRMKDSPVAGTPILSPYLNEVNFPLPFHTPSMNTAPPGMF
ncbi:uncharacterized protein PV06_01319 [Exophiala oligosperma]|uniref:Uncharacterized protein n=1 Tax=Exophiala oligosperma TaxID=215243 RepID=A0A0D2E021_9EURO|nr:uncharacterized protein PV06_01319 [Exophiala oligosperma]KIW48753.1 hypothetical protein PV06_01319 [Exophiala oligosperma]